MRAKYLLLADGKSPHTLKWLNELKKYFELYLITLNGYSQDILECIDRDKIYVVNESVKVAGGNFKLLLKYFEIKKIVEFVEPKYMNAHYITSYGVLAGLVKRKYPHIKLIESAWGSDVLVTPFENFFKKIVTKFALQYADLITSDSFYMSDKIIELSANRNILTFPFGLESVDLTTEYKKDEKLIFSNRALTKNYNIDSVLEWFVTLGSEMKIIVANEGEMREGLKEFVVNKDLEERVEFVGFLNKEEQDAIYKRAQYYISIPSSDSTAVSLLEAMSFGCYPIVSNLAANREWILDGCNGTFFRDDLKLSKVDADVNRVNREQISKRAVFSKSIKEYVAQLENLHCNRVANG